METAEIILRLQLLNSEIMVTMKYFFNDRAIKSRPIEKRTFFDEKIKNNNFPRPLSSREGG